MNPKQEITDLTVCRAWFAAWVFIYHVDLHAQFSAYLGPAAGIIRHGYLGVDGFFILSGLILARVHPEFRNSPFAGMWRFWGKRLARIYPVHLATILILVLLVGAGLGVGITPRDPQRFGMMSLIQNLLLIHGWGFSNHWSWNYPSWSVSTEWAGYLLFPVVWFALSYWPVIISVQVPILGMLAMELLSHVSGHQLNLTFADALLRFGPEFLIGLATARLVPYAADNLPTAIMALIGFGIAFIGGLSGLDGLALPGLWLVLAGLAMQADAERPPVFGRPGLLRGFGLLSYAFYMSFGLSELILAQLFRHQGWDPAANKIFYSLAMTLLTLALAIVLHVSVEKPCRTLGDRWLGPPLAAKAAHR